MNKIISHTLVYLFFDGINKLIPFILLPYLTHHLPTVSFGNLELFNTYIAITIIIISFGLDGWCSSQYYSTKKKAFGTKIKFWLFVSLAISLSLFILLYLYTGSLLIALSPIYSLLSFIIQLRALTFRLSLKILKASAILFLNIAISTILTVYLFRNYEESVFSRIISLFIPLIGLSLFSLLSLIKEYKISLLKIKKDKSLELMTFVLPLVPHGLLNFIKSGADKLVIAKYYGIEILAIFSVGYQFSMVLNIFMLSLNQATMPFLFKALSEKNIRKYISHSICILLFFILFVISFRFISPYIFSNLFSPEYRGSLDIFNSYSYSYPIIFTYILLQNVLFFLGKTKKILFITSCSSAFHLAIIMYISTKHLPLVYAPYALLASALVTLILTLVLLYKSKENHDDCKK